LDPVLFKREKFIREKEEVNRQFLLIIPAYPVVGNLILELAELLVYFAGERTINLFRREICPGGER
jgi:hypothetical protein